MTTKRPVVVHVPESVARLIGETAGAAGVHRVTAIATALWLFGRFSLDEKRALIAEFLEFGWTETGDGLSRVQPPQLPDGATA